MAGFYKRGAAALDDVIEQHEAREAQREAQRGKPMRFWLKAPGSKGFKKGDNEADIIFLDDDVPVIDEHAVEVEKNRWEQFTCLLNIEGADYCPLCEAGNRAYKAAFYPIVDRRSYTTKDGKATYKDQIRLLVAKPTTIKQLRIYQSKMKGLKGKSFSVTRTAREEPNVGNTFVPTESFTKAQIEALLKEAGTIKDDQSFGDVMLNDAKWEELLAPRAVEELEALVGKKRDSKDDEDSVDFD
jgi:hypothetical protein